MLHLFRMCVIFKTCNNWLFHDGGCYHIETSPLICRANQWTGFYMITALVMKELTVANQIKIEKLHFLIFWSITPTSFSLSLLFYYCTLFYPFRPNPRRREKINWNFYFQTLLWCLKRVYKGLKGLYKTFWGTTKKCKNKNLS